MNIDKLLGEREKTHGNYMAMSILVQKLKREMRSQKGWCGINDDIAQSIDMIFVKIARILTGDQHDIDHWRDIEGYARLISMRLEKDEEEED